MRRHVLFPFLVILALSGAELRPQGGPSLAFEIGCGALVGLDRPLRGAYAEALLELDALGMTGGLQGAFVYDAGFGACLLAGDLVIGLGPDLRLVAGGELPLGARKTLASTRSSSPSSVRVPGLRRGSSSARSSAGAPTASSTPEADLRRASRFSPPGSGYARARGSVGEGR
jgi:hypothetical protein